MSVNTHLEGLPHCQREILNAPKFVPVNTCLEALGDLWGVPYCGMSRIASSRREMPPLNSEYAVAENCRCRSGMRPLRPRRSGVLTFRHCEYA